MAQAKGQEEVSEGYLQRKSKLKLCKWWKTNWFVLSGKTLRCFKSEEECRDAKDEDSHLFLNFSDVQVVRAATSGSYNGRFVMEIITKGSTVKLAACDVESRKRWLSWFHRALHLPSISLPLDLAPALPTPVDDTSSVRFSEYWTHLRPLTLNLCDEVLQQIQFNAEDIDKVTQTDFSSSSSSGEEPEVTQHE